MKNIVRLLFLIFVIISCEKKEQEKDLLKFENEKVNNLIKDYSVYEDNFIKILKNGDVGEIKKYSDSANYYDKKLFEVEIINTLSDEERVKYSEQINKIRTEKIEKLQELKNQ